MALISGGRTTSPTATPEQDVLSSFRCMWGPSISLKCNHLPPFNPERRHPPFHRGPSMGFWGGFGEERKRGKREIETDASGRPSLLPRPLCTYFPWEHPPCLSLLRPPLPLPRLPLTRPLPPPSPASVLASCNAPSLGSPSSPHFSLASILPPHYNLNPLHCGGRRRSSLSTLAILLLLLVLPRFSSRYCRERKGVESVCNT